jgi:thioredoxin 1
MTTINSIQEYNALINQGKTVLLDFYADWCGPCRTQIPILEQLSAKIGNDITIAKINIDTQPELARQFGVRSIPTIAIVDNGEVQYQRSGVHTESMLIDLLSVNV